MSKADVSLMVIFDALMQEQSVGIAAERFIYDVIFAIQCFIAYAPCFKDPLFIQDGRSIKPTPLLVHGGYKSQVH